MSTVKREKQENKFEEVILEMDVYHLLDGKSDPLFLPYESWWQTNCHPFLEATPVTLLSLFLN